MGFHYSQEKCLLFLLGVLSLTFYLGYLAGSNQLFQFVLQKSVLYIMSSMAGLCCLIFLPLSIIAENESKNNPPNLTIRTSARENLQRRGSF